MFETENLKVTTAREFYTIAKDIAVATKVLLVEKSTIENSKIFLSSRWENVQPMPGIRSCHSFIAMNEDEIKAAVTSRNDNSRIYKIKRDKNKRPKNKK